MRGHPGLRGSVKMRAELNPRVDFKVTSTRLVLYRSRHKRIVDMMSSVEESSLKVVLYPKY